MHRRSLLVAGLSTVILAACSNSPTAPAPATSAPSPAGGPARSAASKEPLRALIATPELVVGENRFAFGLQRGTRLIEGPTTSVGVYRIEGQRATLLSRVRAAYLPLEVVEGTSHTHFHPDGSVHSHEADGSAQGIYVSHLSFDKPGTWGVEVLLEENGNAVDSARVQVDVLASSTSPAIGSRAPRSHNVIASDVSDLATIDTSDPPDPRLHQVRIDDAIARGRPLLIAFATPRYCTSRVCGPVLDIVRLIMPKYQDRLAFVHQEIWEDFSAQKELPTVREWNLLSEPWIFLVDAKGVVRGKFAGVTTAKELEPAIDAMLAKA